MNIIKKNYHWVIAAVLLLELGVCVGIYNNTTSLYMIPVTQELGVSRGNVSLAYSARNLCNFLSTLFSGILLVKFGYRRLASTALLVSAGAYVILGSAQNVWTLALACAIIGLSDGFCFIAAASRMVNIWFHTHQGLILGLVAAATGLGGSLLSLILSHRIEAVGWRGSYYLSAILIAATAFLIFLFIRNHPSSMGLLPYGSGNHHGKKPKKETRDHWYGYEPKDVFRKPTFYLAIIVVFLSDVCLYAAYMVVVPHLQDCDMTASQAASIQSILMLGLAASKLVCGFLSDHIGIKITNTLCMICCVLGLILLTCVNGYAIAIAAVLIFSLGLVMLSVTIPLLSSALFGYHPQGSIVGIFMALPAAASMIILPVVNAIYDRIGSYKPIFLTAAAVGVVTLGLMLLLFVLAGRDRKKYETTHPELQSLEEA